MKIGLVHNVGNQKAEKLVGDIEKYVAGAGGETVVGELAGCDFILSLGGDGTLIHAVSKNMEQGIPVMGINTGTLGFLTAVEAQDWKIAVDAVLGGSIFISQRLTLEISVGVEKFRAVNEAVIKGLYRVIELEVAVGGAEFLKVFGDGIMVATQTGSTAYSLSSGGPIVDPALDAILVTPVNPIGLPIPSVVLSPDKVVEIELMKGDGVTLIIDGQEHTKVAVGTKITVSRGRSTARLAYLDEGQFLGALNMKFGLAKRVAS